MNLFTKQKQSHKCKTKQNKTKQTYHHQKISEGVINWKTEIDIYTLLYLNQITNKNLLYSTENSTQYSVMACMGKESLKKSGYMYMCN